LKLIVSSEFGGTECRRTEDDGKFLVDTDGERQDVMLSWRNWSKRQSVMDFSGLVDLAPMSHKVDGERLFISLGSIEHTPVSDDKLVNSSIFSFQR